MREVIKKVLRVLQEDKAINCNQYQGKDFEVLVKKIAALKVKKRRLENA